MAAHNVQSKRDFVKVLQYKGEGNTVTTPANYAAAITSPTFIPIGKVTDINLQPDIQNMDSDILGDEDVVDAVKTGELFAFQISFEMADTALINYAYSESGGGVGSIDESITFAFSELINGVENYTAMYGSRPTSCTCVLDKGIWTANMTFICKEITIPSATNPWNGSIPVWASEPSTSAMSHSGVGTTPFLYNAIAYPESRFSCSVTRGMAIQDTNGNLKIEYCKASTRRTEFSVDVFIKTNVLETEYNSKTERTASYSISTAPNKDFSFTDCVITGYNRQKTASNSSAFRETITVRAGGVSIAAV